MTRVTTAAKERILLRRMVDSLFLANTGVLFANGVPEGEMGWNQAGNCELGWAAGVLGRRQSGNGGGDRESPGSVAPGFAGHRSTARSKRTGVRSERTI